MRKQKASNNGIAILMWAHQSTIWHELKALISLNEISFIKIFFFWNPSWPRDRFTELQPWTFTYDQSYSSPGFILVKSILKHRKHPPTPILFTFVFIYKNLYSQHVLLDAVLKLLAESILYKLNNLAPCFICKGSMYLCLPTSVCKGVSERPRIRRAVSYH